MKIGMTVLVLVLVMGCAKKEPLTRGARAGVVFTHDEDQFGRWIIRDRQFTDWISSHCKIKQQMTPSKPVDPQTTALFLECSSDSVTY